MAYLSRFSKPIKAGLTVLGLVLALVIGYSNCSKYSLTGYEKIEFSQAKTNGNICTDPHTGTTDKYVMIKFGVVNLNVRIRDSKLLADSDADGIPDVDEAARGFSPDNPRSAGGANLLLDSLCPNQGPSSASLCPAPVNCDWIPNKLGLTTCDLVSRQGLNDGVDSDRDKIPDLVEFLKGTMPNFDDADSDLDHDGQLLWEELDQGRDPGAPDSVFPQLLISFSATKLKDSEPHGDCATPQDYWSYSLNNIPLIKTLAVAGSDSVSSRVPEIFSHAENQNVIFIYYIVAKFNDDPNNPAPKYLFGQFIRVNYHIPVINVGTFEKLGIIDGTFRPVQ